jgi:hypothetical protein
VIVPEVKIFADQSPGNLENEVNLYIERKAREGLEITYSGMVTCHDGLYSIQVESFRTILDDEVPGE